MTKPTINDAGCWIDGSWGQYGVARMAIIAGSLGYDDSLIVDIAQRKLGSMATTLVMSEEDEQLLEESADEVEQWLNDHVAPEGLSFGWYYGDFFLQSAEWWQGWEWKP